MTSYKNKTIPPIRYLTLVWKTIREYLLVISLAFLLTACAVVEPNTGEEEAEPETAGETETTPAPTQPPAIPEQRLLSLEWPPVIRQGDSDLVILTLQMDEAGQITPTAKYSGHETYGEKVEIPNLYETHNVMAEARLDLAGVVVTPGDITSMTLLPGKTVTFSWSVQPDQPNTYRGAVWFYLRFIPKDGSPDYQHLVSTQPIEIRCVNFLGLSGTMARVIGGVGALFGSVISIDTIAGWGWRLYKKKSSHPRLMEKD